MDTDFRARLRSLSTRARIIIALIAALFLLAVSLGCSMVGLLMMAFSTDACTSLPQYMGLYIFLPPAFLLLASVLPPILFALRQNIYWVLGTAIAGFVLSGIAFVGWYGLLIGAC